MLVRAGATNAPMVSALGVDIKRLFMIVFGFGAMLAGFAGAMVAPILSVEPGMGDQILILAFVVIVIGGIGSIRGAFVAALLVGVIDTLGRSFMTDALRLFLPPSTARVDRAGARLHGDLSADGRRPGRAPGRPVSGQGTRLMPHRVAQRLGCRSRRASGTLTFDQRMAAGLFALMALLPLLSPVLGGSYLLLIGERVMIFAIAALSLELLIGVGGLVSFGHAAFLGVGAYAAGILASHGLGTLSVALPAALVASALFALATGAIAVRTRGVYFIMITLAFGQMAFFVATSLAPYGGDDGLTWPTRTLVLGTRVLKSETAFFYVILALLVATYLLVEPPHRLPLRPRAARAHRQRDAHAGDRLHALSLSPHGLRHRRHHLRARRLPARQPGRVRQPRLHALAALGRADHDGAAGRHRHALRPDRRRGWPS